MLPFATGKDPGSPSMKGVQPVVIAVGVPLAGPKGPATATPPMLRARTSKVYSVPAVRLGTV